MKLADALNINKKDDSQPDESKNPFERMKTGLAESLQMKLANKLLEQQKLVKGKNFMSSVMKMGFVKKVTCKISEEETKEVSAEGLMGLLRKSTVKKQVSKLTQDEADQVFKVVNESVEHLSK